VDPGPVLRISDLAVRRGKDLSEPANGYPEARPEGGEAGGLEALVKFGRWAGVVSGQVGWCGQWAGGRRRRPCLLGYVNAIRVRRCAPGPDCAAR
jgi:hypothetical protein